MTFDTVQTNSVDANAGLQQIVNVSTPAAQLFPSQTGLGWAQSAGMVSSGLSGTSAANWGFYAVMLALVWFIYKTGGG
jgi:hypothetical protein